MPWAKGSKTMQLHALLKPTHAIDIVNHVPILYMTTENDIDNLLDFTAYKMRSIIEDLASTGRLDYANAMQDALDSYLLDDIDIAFVDGWPYVVDNTEDISL